MLPLPGQQPMAVLKLQSLLTQTESVLGTAQVMLVVSFHKQKLSFCLSFSCLLCKFAYFFLNSLYYLNSCTAPLRDTSG